VHPQSGANFNSRFSSREAAKNVKNAKEKNVYGLSAPSLEQDFLATKFRHLRVLCGFA
jgi:hypothetical protein